MTESDARDPMDSFERELADSLRRRADGVPAAPLGYTDVQRRIVHRRRRTATMAAAAVTLPAVIGLGFLAGRSTGDERVASDGAVMFGETTVPVPLTTYPMMTTVFPTTTTFPAVAGSTFRCQGPPVATDELWQYFGYCEYAPYEPVYDPGLVVQTTTIPMPVEPFPTTTTIPPTTTTTTLLPPGTGSAIDPDVLAAEVLVVDASGGVASMAEVAALLGVAPRFAVVATRTVDETLVMPLGADVTAAFAVLERFDVGGFDTWTPDLVSGELPSEVTVVLVVGTDGPVPWRP